MARLRFVRSRKRDGGIVVIWPAYARRRAELGSSEQGCIETGARQYKDVAISTGHKNKLGYQSTFDNNKSKFVSPCVNLSTFKLGLTIMYIGTLAHIAALRSDLSFFMQ